MRHCTTLVLFLCSWVVVSHSAHASYNTLPRADAASLGMSDANVALATGPSAQFINPANLVVDLPTGWGWEAGSLLGRVRMELTRSPSQKLLANTEYPIIPFIAVSSRYSNRLAVGFGVDVPFGIGVEWDDRDFEFNFGALGSHDVAKRGGITVVRAGPALGWLITDAVSVGGRLFAQYVDAYDESDLGKAEGDGASPGAQIGLNYRAEHYALGASYTSRTNTELDARSIRIGETAYVPAKVDLRGPDRLQAGFARKFGDAVWWEFDLDWIGWSYVEELPIRRADGTILNAGRTARDYSNTLSYRTGLRWRLKEDRYLYVGLGYDPTPVPKEQASASVNNLRMTRVSVGTSWKLTGNLRLDTAYQFVHGHSRRITETAQDDIAGIDTGMFEGTYRSETHVLGLTLSGSF